MTALSRTDMLFSLSIRFPKETEHFIGIDLDSNLVDAKEERLASFGNGKPKFGFSGLRKLLLYNLWGDIRSWRQQIFQVLLSSPEFEDISLSIAYITIEKLNNLEPEGDEEDCNFYLDLFRWLCHEYTASLVTPLKLKSLHLGEGISFPELALIDDEFDSSILEKVHFHNWYSDPLTYKTPWDLLLAANSPKLRYISLSEMNEDCCKMIQGNLGMNIAIGLRFGSYGMDDSIDYSSSLPYSLFAHNERFRPPMLVLPARHFPKDTDLSPLRNNSWIVAFSLDIREYVTSSLDELERCITGPSEILATFSVLKYLQVKIWYWSTSIPVHIVERVAKACCSLCYIRINGEGWRVHRHEDPTGVVLETMDEWQDEIEGLDFFAWAAKIDVLEGSEGL